jgi:prevent-host-death family protein
VEIGMIETLSTLDLRQRLGDLLNRVSLRHDHFIVARKGKPLAALVPIELLRQMEELAKLQLKAALIPRKTAISQAEADALANDAKHRSRKRKAR